MSAALEKLIEKEIKKKRIEIIKRLIKDGTFSNEKIAQIMEFSLEEVNKIAEEL